jgi:hypothetical protein
MTSLCLRICLTLLKKITLHHWLGFFYPESHIVHYDNPFTNKDPLVQFRHLGYGENCTPRENETESLQSNSKKDLQGTCVNQFDSKGKIFFGRYHYLLLILTKNCIENFFSFCFSSELH